MKKQFVQLFAMTMIVFCSCTRDNNNNSNNVNVSDGAWKVTLFSEDGDEETSDFSGYSFTFGTGSALTVTKSGVATAGTWSKTSTKFNIDLGVKSDGNKPLGELTDDWKIISVSSTEIKLTDDNSSSNEFLTFTKN